MHISSVLLGTMMAMGLALPGCGGASPSFSIEERHSCWKADVVKPTPGIDEATVTAVTITTGSDERVSFVVWSDVSNSTDESGRSSGQGKTHNGTFAAAAGTRIAFQAETHDGNTGHVDIAGVRYELENGELFLVSTQVASPKILQLDFPFNDFPIGRDQMTELAHTNADIRDFFNSCMKTATMNPEAGHTQ